MKAVMIWLAVWVCGVWSVSPAEGQSLPAAGDSHGVWLLEPRKDQPDVHTVLHHVLTELPTRLHVGPTVRGAIHPKGLACLGHTLWLVYQNGQVQTLRAVPSPLQDGWVFRDGVATSLPRGVALRGFAVTADGPWALVRVEDRQTLDQLDGLVIESHEQRIKSRRDKRRRNLLLGLPPRHGLRDQVADEEDRDESGAVTHHEEPQRETVLPVDRLLQLERGAWRVHPLPDDWPHGVQAWLVADRPEADTPLLVSRLPGLNDGQAQVVVFRHADDSGQHWTREAYALPWSAEASALAFTCVESQLIGATVSLTGGDVSADLAVLRGGRVYPIGRLLLDGIEPGAWSLLGTGNAAALVGRRDSESLGDTTGHEGDAAPYRWSRLDLRGHIVLEPTGLMPKRLSAADQAVQYVMVGLVVVLATVLMLAFWRRDASWNKLDLPKGLELADLSKRAFAAMIDVMPGLVGAMYYFDLSFEQILLRWPGNGLAMTLEQMAPGAMVIGVFVGHTTLTELVIARTLGKSLLGLKTVSLNGSRPKAWQLLVRGLLKILDLIPGAWLLLMLPVISPHRQRLGDLVARTVVVSSVVQPDEKSGEGSD